MEKSRKKDGEPSRPEWEGLDAWVRDQVRQFIQHALEDEVTEVLGRRRPPAGRRSMPPLGIATGTAHRGS